MSYTMFKKGHWGALAVAGSVVVLAACGGDGNGQDAPYVPDPPVGATSFISAAVDGVGPDRFGEVDDDAAIGAPDGGGDDRVVEEGDIYRLLGNDLLLNVNAYRGVQIIDYGDLDEPAIVGSVRVSGSPVEAYVVGDQAIVLLNSWYGYYGSELGSEVSPQDVGLVLLVDLEDPSVPSIVAHAPIEGAIQTSRLTTGTTGTALYVAAAGWDSVESDGAVTSTDAWPGSDRTVVTSLRVEPSSLSPVSELELGGWVNAIQATTDALLVARTNWSEGKSSVAVVDISDPAGSMVEGADVEVEGYVESQFNLDLRGDVLRVVSGGLWGGSDANHVQTFDVSDIQAPTQIDQATFGEEEDLYATLFVDNRAFFVTYFRVDPFHAFEITDEGMIAERSEFVVSGWNDYFKTAFDTERLVGVGINDEADAWTLSVSLYDITDLADTEPLVARADVELDRSWSEASWDHRAFTVLDDAVDVVAPEGGTETGLVLLPFQGWEDDGYVSGVQLFTFSRDSLTPRGVMDHDTPVRRSFVAADDTAANLSEVELGLYDITDVDAPEELSRLELAASFSDVMVFGDHIARLRNTTDYSWYRELADLPPWRVEVVAPGADPDVSPAVASVDVPPGAWVTRVGELLVSIAMSYDWSADEDERYHADIAVHDLADPTAPVAAGTLTTNALRPGFDYGWPAVDAISDCWDCGWYWGYSFLDPDVVGDTLVFTSSRTESEPAGTREVCMTWPADAWNGSVPGEPEPYEPGNEADEPPSPGQWPVITPDGEDGDEVPEDGETHIIGWIECVSDNGAPAVCDGQLYECEWYSENCRPVSVDAVDTETECYSWDLTRYWQRVSLQVLDLRDPGAPVLHDPIELPREDEGVTTRADDDAVYISFRRPLEVEDDPREFVRYYVRRVALSDPAAPVVGEPVNVPGALLAVEGDVIYTWDPIYAGEAVETALSRLTLRSDGLAELEARYRFAGRTVEEMLLDGDGHAVVSHRPSWTAVDVWENGDPITSLTVLDAAELTELSTIGISSWATLKHAVAGRALMQVPGGVLVLNLDDASAPEPQAWFATLGWPQATIVHERDILLAAGRYGLYRFDLDERNLLGNAPPE